MKLNLSLKNDAQRLCFCSGAFPKPHPVPRNQTLNEDKAENQLVTAPLQKHFVVRSFYKTVH